MKFCMILSLILVIAKILGLITLGWGTCLAPVIVTLIVKIALWLAIIIIGFILALKDD